MECLNNIIGISKTPCDCLGIEATESLSGLYLDDTNHARIPLSAAVWDCSDPEINAFFERVRMDAVNETLDLLSMELNKSLLTNYQNTSFTIPTKTDFSGLLPNSGDFHFLCLKTVKIKGPYFKINKVQIPTHTGIFYITDSDGNTLFQGLQSEFKALRLDLTKDYFIAYQPTSGYRNYKLKCCGNQPPYKNLFESGSGTSSTLEGMKFTESNYSAGIILDVFSSCDPFKDLCYMDFKTEPWGRVFATTVLLVARKNLASWLINSGQYTNYTNTNSENLSKLIEYYMKEISDRIEFMPYNYNFAPCFRCAGVQKGSIII
jgi:hypothetical protein